MLAWGQRVTIINKSKELFGLMGASPHEFILNHKEADRQRFEKFKHRTFQYTDTLYFLEFLQWFYRENESLESAFLVDSDMKTTITEFKELFFHLPTAPKSCLLYTSPSPRDATLSRMPSSA